MRMSCAISFHDIALFRPLIIVRQRYEMEELASEAKTKSIDSFLIEKTYQSLTEASKNIQVSAGIFVIIVATISIVVFSEAVEDMISVPLLGLKLKRWYAAEVFLVAIAANMYRFFTLQAYALLLQYKLATLLKKAGEVSYPWYIANPTVFNFHGLIWSLKGSSLLPKRVQFIPKILKFLYFFFGALYPVFVAWIIGEAVDFAWHWWVSSALAIVLITSTFIVIFSLPDIKLRGGFIRGMDHSDPYSLKDL